MNVLDLIIIYFSFGAPFGVYFFVQCRERYTGKTLWIKTLLAAAMWPFEAFKLIRGRFTRNDITEVHFDSEQTLDARAEKRVAEIRRIFEDLFFVSDTTSSVYEFRGAFERYVGLSLALIPGTLPANVPEAEIFRLAGHKNPSIGTHCLNRRNRSRLLCHQNDAREELLKMLARISAFPENGENVGKMAQELADILKDGAASSKMKEIFALQQQTGEERYVKDLGSELWKPEIQERLPTRLASMTLQAKRSAATLPIKD